MKLGNLIGRDGQKVVYQKVGEANMKREKLPDLTINKKLQLLGTKDLTNQELIANLKVFSDFRKEYFQVRASAEKKEKRQIFLLQREIARMENLEKVRQQRVTAKVWKEYKPQVNKNGIPHIEKIPVEWKSEEKIS